MTIGRNYLSPCLICGEQMVTNQSQMHLKCRPKKQRRCIECGDKFNVANNKVRCDRCKIKRNT